ncbi:hypothetical protein GMORB2_3404 [Geosmithia morbida]|uniref:Amino acid transporter transmembrane domain-containing protein n=1 Tax=Geosmithia morbida TaxID=1094350 RepID=A0A9P4YN31_9HYPO|nr:uncharacterized protein GMORB2_3404 [Geosmithia morbida]KAF4119993.1 hypothetical protein GMORB2_3404 [Geosmithia morbida]
MRGIADAAELMLGRSGKEMVGFIYYIYLAMTAGAGILTTSVALNALSDHAICTTLFVSVPLALAFLIGIWFRGLEEMAWISRASVGSILTSVCVVAFAVLTKDRPAAAPSTGSIDLNMHATPNRTLSEAMTAISIQLFAVGASGAFFSVSAEMEDSRQFTRSLLLGQTFIVATCIVTASIVYGKVGQCIANPALGSAGTLIKKVSHGIALLGLVVTAILYSHIAAKYILVRIWRGTADLQSNTVQRWTVWVGAVTAAVVFGFIIVGVVPFLGDFLSLVGALVKPVLTNVIPGFTILLFLARGPVKAARDPTASRGTENTEPQANFVMASFQVYREGWKRAAAHPVACFMLLAGLLIIIGGTYATVLSIKRSYGNGEVGGVFPCADDSLG